MRSYSECLSCSSLGTWSNFAPILHNSIRFEKELRYSHCLLTLTEHLSKLMTAYILHLWHSSTFKSISPSDICFLCLTLNYLHCFVIFSCFYAYWQKSDGKSFIGTVAKFWKATISFVLSVRVDFHEILYLSIFRKPVENSEV